MAVKHLVLDNADEMKITVQRGSDHAFICKLQDGESWDHNGRIIIASDYDSSPLAVYKIGDRVSITDNGGLLVTINSNDFDDRDAVFDFSFLQYADKKRDIKGQIIINKSLSQHYVD